MIKRDFHSHTTFCDGKDTAEVMVRSAIDKGLEAYGISAHSYLKGHDWCMNCDDYASYQNEIAHLKKKYEERITLYCGIEQDVNTVLKPNGFDYVIGSVHSISKNGSEFAVDDTPDIFSAGVEEYFEGNYYAAAEAYYESVSHVVDKTGCDIIGHFDLITKFNENARLFNVSNKRYVDAALSAASELLKKNIVFEINTGAISRGWRSFAYPDLFIMDYLAEHGASFVLSSDSHSADFIAFKFEEYEQLLRDSKWNLIDFTPNRI